MTEAFAAGAGTIVRGIVAVMLTVAGGLLVLSMLPVALHWQSTVVMSGSMAPRILPGDVVASAPVRARDLVPGQVVLVRNPAAPDRLLMHRFVRWTADGRLVTKGDANAAPDSTGVPVSHLVGLPRLRVPFVGLPALWLHQGKTGQVVVVLSALLALLVVAVGRGPEPGAHRRDAMRRHRRVGVHRVARPDALVTAGCEAVFHCAAVWDGGRAPGRARRLAGDDGATRRSPGLPRVARRPGGAAHTWE